MTPLDLLLAVARVTIVGAIALALGGLLLRRLPDAVALLALTALTICGLLLAVSGTDWPILWLSSLATPVAESKAADGSLHIDPQAALSRPAVSLDSLHQFLQRLDGIEVKPTRESRTWFILCFVLLVVVPVVRLLVGLSAAVWLHTSSKKVLAPRLLRLAGDARVAGNGASGLIFRVSTHIDAPCVMAFHKRCVYLPMNWQDYSEDELAASVSHEIAHLGRGDARWRLAAQFAAAFQYFHPFTYLLLRQLVLSQELSADERAVGMIGRQRFLHGISQLALRLDAHPTGRNPKGLGLSHSSSFLIRRIKMIRDRNASRGRKRDRLLSRVASPLVLCVGLASAAWSVSADEPLRIARGNAPTRRVERQSPVATPWRALPGLDGYWHLHVDAAMKHPAIGQWLKQGDAQWLAPGWEWIARPEFKHQRDALGLALENVEGMAGTVTIKVQGLQPSDSGQDLNTSLKSSAFVLRMKEPVDWVSIGEALAKERLHAAIASSVGPDFPQEEAQKMISADIVSTFFASQQNPRQLQISSENEQQTADTAQPLKSLWQTYAGDLATLAFRIPDFAGHRESPYQQLVADFHEVAEFFLVGVSRSKTANDVRLRICISPRARSVTRLAKSTNELLEATAKKFQAEVRDDESSAELTRALLAQLRDCRPKVVLADAPGQTDAVVIDIDLPVQLLWRVSAM